MSDHHDEFWTHPWAVRLSRLVHDDSLTAKPAWHDAARGLVMDIENTWRGASADGRKRVMKIPVQGDGDLLALTRDRAIEAENRLVCLLAVAKEIAASAEPCVICAQTPHRSDCALVAAIAKAEGKGQAA